MIFFLISLLYILVYIATLYIPGASGANKVLEQYLPIAIIGVIACIGWVAYDIRLTSSKQLKDLLGMVERLIKIISDYRNQFDQISNNMNNKCTVPSQEKLSELRREYHKNISGELANLKLNNPGEQEFHGDTLKYDNPIDRALKDFQFFHVNLAIQYMDEIIPKLENWRDNPESLKLEEEP